MNKKALISALAISGSLAFALPAQAATTTNSGVSNYPDPLVLRPMQTPNGAPQNYGGMVTTPHASDSTLTLDFTAMVSNGVYPNEIDCEWTPVGNTPSSLKDHANGSDGGGYVIDAANRATTFELKRNSEAVGAPYTIGVSYYATVGFSGVTIKCHIPDNYINSLQN